MRIKNGFTPLEVRPALWRYYGIARFRLAAFVGRKAIASRRLLTGFTIIELMVVIAVIGLIAAVALGLFAAPKANSRDARREKDMKEISTALGLYVNTAGTYPDCGSDLVALEADCFLAPLVDESVIRATPRDPLDNGSCDAGFSAASFKYCYESLGSTSYALYYHLETDTIDNPSGSPVNNGWYSITP